MGITICFANNKGGVGKSTSAYAIGYAWARMGKKILLVDLDSQDNLTSMVSPLEPDQHEFKYILTRRGSGYSFPKDLES